MLAQVKVNAGNASSAVPGKPSMHKMYPRGRASALVLLDSLDPRRLGASIALHEHKVFVQSVLRDVEPFDQWGVEFGKQLASRYPEALETGARQGMLPGIAADIVAARIQGAE